MAFRLERGSTYQEVLREAAWAAVSLGFGWRTSVSLTSRCVRSLGHFSEQTGTDLCPHGTYILLWKIILEWRLTKARWRLVHERLEYWVCSKADSGMGEEQNWLSGCTRPEPNSEQGWLVIEPWRGSLEVHFSVLRSHWPEYCAPVSAYRWARGIMEAVSKGIVTVYRKK